LADVTIHKPAAIVRKRQWQRLSGRGQDFELVHSQETYLVSTRDQAVSRRLYETGQFDFDKFGIAMALLGRTRVGRLVDVGANIGTISIPALRRGLAERATAIEPDPLNFWLLEVNVTLNHIHNRIECLQAACTSIGTGDILLERSPTNYGDHRITLKDSTRSSHSGSVRVPSVRLDDVVSHLSDGDLVWMDVQGYEIEVLKGSPTVLESGAALVTELWPFGLQEQGSLDEVAETLGSFKCFYDLSERQPSQRPIHEVLSLIERLGVDGAWTDILCVH